MKLELLAIVAAAMADETYGIAAQLAVLKAAGPVFGIDAPDVGGLTIATAATDDRVAMGQAPTNLPAAIVAVGLTPARAGGEISQGCREWPSVSVVVSWVERDTNAAQAWSVGDYIETAILRAFAQAVLDPARVTVAGKVGAVQIQTCNGVTSGPVMKPLKESAAVITHAVAFDLNVIDYQPTLLP